MKKLQIATILLFTVIPLSCGPKPTPMTQENDAIVKAYKLIDEDRPGDAIELLKPLYQRNPGRAKLRIALASAFAARGGIRVPKFYDLILSLLNEKTNTPSNLIAEFDKAVSGLDPKLVSEARSVLRGIIAIADLVRKLKALPLPGEPEIADVNEAIILLDGVAREDKGALLYKNVLKTIELRSRLENKVIPANFHPEPGGCRIHLPTFSLALKDLFAEVHVITEDLFYLFPESLSESENVAAFLSKAADDLARFIEIYKIKTDILWPCAQ
jgi:hypothetical protein